MTNEQLVNLLTETFSGAEVKQGTQYPEITVKVSQLHETALKLRDDKSLAFDYLICLSGVDYAENMAMVYHLESTTHRHMIVLKTRTEGREKPAVDSVYDIWPTAEFHEREIYDLLGVSFNNHPDQRRLFLDDDWGHPLRKDYVDHVHIVER